MTKQADEKEAQRPWVIRDVPMQTRRDVKSYAAKYGLSMAQALERLVILGLTAEEGLTTGREPRDSEAAPAPPRQVALAQPPGQPAVSATTMADAFQLFGQTLRATAEQADAGAELTERELTRLFASAGLLKEVTNGRMQATFANSDDPLVQELRATIAALFGGYEKVGHRLREYLREKESVEEQEGTETEAQPD